MLKKTPKNSRSHSQGRGQLFAIVASRYNALYVNGLLRAAHAALHAAGAAEVEVVRVPGSYEIPLAASELARRNLRRPVAILCLGVIWQGETAHAHHIGEAITQALMRLQMETGVPCIHEVLLVNNRLQARARCLEPATNRGTEAAVTALKMSALLRALRGN